MKGIFITGTDTGVGKTVVTATLVRLLRRQGVDAIAIKPFATGIGPETRWQDNDPLILAAAMDYAEAPEVISPVRLLPPLSPYDAARESRTQFDIDAISAVVRALAARHQFVVVEGVGGVSVPLTEETSVADFAQHLQLPALVVARSRIGTINHTLLTIGALRQAGVHTEGLLFIRPEAGELALDEKVGPETACRFARVACFGLVEHSTQFASAQTLEEAIQALPINDPSLVAVAAHLTDMAVK